MSSIFYFLVEFYPFWGIPGILILFEVANHSRRNLRHRAMFLALAGCSILGLLTVGYFWVGGRLPVRTAMQNIEHKFLH